MLAQKNKRVPTMKKQQEFQEKTDRKLLQQSSILNQPFFAKRMFGSPKMSPLDATTKKQFTKLLVASIC
jgi:hypothetical protein